MKLRFEGGGSNDKSNKEIVQELEHLFSQEGVVEKIIEPFINVGDDDLEKKLSLSSLIVFLLNQDYDILLEKIRSNPSEAVFFRDAVNEVGQALKQGLISKKAFWFKILENRMVTFKLFTTDTTDADIKRGTEEYEKWAKEAGDRILKSVLKDMKDKAPESGDSGGSKS